MPMKRLKSSLSVVEAAAQRIKNVFSNGLPVYMSFSGGKDSLCLATLTMNLIKSGEIDPHLLRVHFVDEEAIFDCIERTVIKWRRMFLAVGASFDWLCLEIMHYNCFSELEEVESFICWDSRQQDLWIRQPPPFAMRTHPLLKARVDRYQQFLPRFCADGITIVGLRAAESVQRLQFLSRLNTGAGSMTGKQQVYPMYDWKDNDVWLYLKEQHVEIPDIYLYLWQSGTGKNKLRVSQFFSVDTAVSLVKMNQYYPDLMDRIIKREPNAYLAALYWDSEMFGRHTRTRRALEEEDTRDHRALLLKMFGNMDTYFTTPHKRYIAERYRHLFIRISSFASAKDLKAMYEALVRGDPKLRTYRALYQNIYARYATAVMEEREAVKQRA